LEKGAITLNLTETRKNLCQVLYTAALQYSGSQTLASGSRGAYGCNRGAVGLVFSLVLISRKAKSSRKLVSAKVRFGHFYRPRAHDAPVREKFQVEPLHYVVVGTAFFAPFVIYKYPKH
jgi:hypothetical protein